MTRAIFRTHQIFINIIYIHVFACGETYWDRYFWRILKRQNVGDYPLDSHQNKNKKTKLCFSPDFYHRDYKQARVLRSKQFEGGELKKNKSILFCHSLTEQRFLN